MRFSTSSRPDGFFSCTFRAALALGSILLADTACAGPRISGTYVAHGPNYVNMLQLTQTDQGQITGVLSSMEVDTEGKLTAEQASVTGGAVDADQLTLTLNPGLLGANIAGTIKGDTIELQTVGPNGDLFSCVFVRSSPGEFKTDAEQLKSKANGIILTARLLRTAQVVRQTVQNAEEWIANAETHAQKIPGVEDYYRKLEEAMQSLVARERVAPSSVARTQISVEVIQGNVAGTQADVQINQMWDGTIGDAGRHLSETLATQPSTCGTPEELRKSGAAPPAVEIWENVCQQALAERAKFDPTFKRIMEKRAELKAFQTAAQSHRQALVDEAGRIQ